MIFYFEFYKISKKLFDFVASLLTRLKITTRCSEGYRVTKYIFTPLHSAVEFLLDGIDTH